MVNFTQSNQQNQGANTYQDNNKLKEQFIKEAERIIHMTKDEIMEDLRQGKNSLIKNTILGLHDYECNDFGINMMVGKSIFLDAGLETETIEIDGRRKTYNVLIDNNEDKLKEYLQRQVQTILSRKQ